MSDCTYHGICGLLDDADPEAQLCILHSHNPDKDKHEFRKKYDYVMRGSANFANAFFPEETVVFYKRVKQSANFENATFEGFVDFSETRFEGPISFNGATFTKRANFSEALFTRGANFGGAMFTQGANFDKATFTERANFGEATFTETADFSGATFIMATDFCRATFIELASFNKARLTEANFGGVTFTKAADFSETTFTEEAIFGGATFTKGANFFKATFTKAANFFKATFTKAANFGGARFTEGANFRAVEFFSGIALNTAKFSPKAMLSFRDSQFQGRIIFTADQKASQEETQDEGGISAFTNAQQVDFRNVVIELLDTLTFIGADFTKCQFLGTDLRKVQLVGITWPQQGYRMIVYDEELLQLTLKKDRLWHAAPQDGCTEFCTRETGTCTLCEALAERYLFLWGWFDALFGGRPRGTYPWNEIEQLYRQLKQNYEDQRDSRRAGDFHYGEKEMQRRNPLTRRGARVLLWLYWLVSGYGERIGRPLVCASVLFVIGTYGYLSWGLKLQSQLWRPLLGIEDWLTAANYSIRVMTFLRPTDLAPQGFAKLVHTIQSLLGPLFLGLFALAVRQRLKR